MRRFNNAFRVVILKVKKVTVNLAIGASYALSR